MADRRVSGGTSWTRAYLRASAAACAVLLAGWMAAALAVAGPGELADVLFLAPQMALLVLGATCVLGGAAHDFLQRAGWRRMPCYLGAGFVLGALIPLVVFRLAGGPAYLAGAVLLFGATGATAAGTFRRLWAGDGGEAGAVAAGPVTGG